MDAPFYSVTGWGNAWVPQDEVLPVQASYVDGTWLGGLKPLAPPKELLFSDVLSLARDTTVAADMKTDVFAGTRVRYDPARYPFAMAEMGGGMLTNPTRRPLIPAIATEAQALTRLGEGANLLGYYMYAGGSQPHGLTGWLGVPGLPQVNYDYQAPIGEYGTAHESYFRTKWLHQFLTDFGETLAPLEPSLPANQPAADDPSKLRFALRSDGKIGFVFFSNYQYHLPMPAKDGVRFAVKLGDGEVAFPSHPVTVAADAMGIWPVNLPLADATLTYASATPLMHFTTDGVERFVFIQTPDVPPEFSLRNLVDGESRVVQATVNKPVALTTAAGAKVELLVLSQADAFDAYVVTLAGRRRLAVSRAEVWQDGNT